VDGDGKPELVAHDGTRWGLIQPDWDHPTSAWRFLPITAAGKFEPFYHGEGIGDVNGDGRPDLILNEGWYERPADRNTQWTRHEFKFGDKGGAQMFALDVDGDGDNDIISAIDAHGWGLAWFEQVKANGNITFKKHFIMGDRDEEAKYGIAFTQPHALAFADMDGDGLLNMIAGNRRWAHGPEGDIEPMAEPVVYGFRLVRDGANTRFEPHLIDRESGVGVQVTAADVNGDDRSDVLTVSKLGAFGCLSQPAGKRATVFPRKDWEAATPESHAVDAAKLQAAIGLLEKTVGKDGVHELMIIRNGRLIWPGDDIDKVPGVWSLTKSFTSTALGLLIDDGRCTLDTKAKDILPALTAAYPAVTLRHFTTMTSGYRAMNDEPRGTYRNSWSGITAGDVVPHKSSSGLSDWVSGENAISRRFANIPGG
jgi:hypothetical protein